VLRVEGTTPYAKFVKGEIPILIGYENDGLKAKYADRMGDAADVVIPQDGSVSAPYAMSLVKNGPNPSAAQLWLNLVMSDVGQALFAQGYVRPAVPGAGGAGRRGEAAECAAGSPARCREGGRAQGRGRPAVVAGHARQLRGSRCRLSLPERGVAPLARFPRPRCSRCASCCRSPRWSTPPADGGRAFAAVLRDPLVAAAIARSLALGVGAGTLSVGVGVPPPSCWRASRRPPPLVAGAARRAARVLRPRDRVRPSSRSAARASSPCCWRRWAPIRTRSAARSTRCRGSPSPMRITLIPRVALMIYPALANFDRRPLEAALTLGARPWRAWLGVAWRELWPSIMSAWCLVTAIALGTYGTALALAGTQINILPLLMYLKLSDGQTDFSQAAVLSIVLTAICTCVLALGKALFGNGGIEWSAAARDSSRGWRSGRTACAGIGCRWA
jgi:putative spermidine/putrescine transport system permease protein